MWISTTLMSPYSSSYLPYLSGAVVEVVEVVEVAFCVILGSENVYLDNNFFFLNQLETEIIKHVYSGGHFEKK